jgi:glycosyltransferase involved in cell wall biosynthesis
MDEKVSIITPVYNSAKYIGECINSVLAQSYGNFEMILVDDGSTDNSEEIIKEFQKSDDRLILIRLKENSGPAIARNTGIKKASGRYMTFLDGDDVWFPNMLEKSINTLKERNCSFVFSSYKSCDENLEPLLSDFIVPGKAAYRDILKSNSISCLTAFIDIGKLGKKYMPNIRKRQDYGLWLAYLKEIDHAVGIKEPLAIYRIRRNSLSRNKFSAMKYQWQVYTKLEKLDFLKSVYYLSHWGVRGLMKYRS